MGISDQDYVNFSEEEYYELDNHLEKVNKSESKANRAKLTKLGDLIKDISGKSMLKHEEFGPFVALMAEGLEDKK